MTLAMKQLHRLDYSHKTWNLHSYACILRWAASPHLPVTLGCAREYSSTWGLGTRLLKHMRAGHETTEAHEGWAWEYSSTWDCCEKYVAPWSVVHLGVACNLMLSNIAERSQFVRTTLHYLGNTVTSKRWSLSNTVVYYTSLFPAGQVLLKDYL